MPSPDQIGRYRVDRRLGSGAFAVVWLAHDDRLEAPVAVKVMADNWAHRMDIRDRFLAEARLLRKASSGGVVQVFDVGELDGEKPYFVMEYADRGTVADRMAAGPLPVDEAVRLTAEAARGAEALHEAGVVHRDIKPSNVLLTSGGPQGRERVLVADLGLAKNLAHASGLTVVAGSVGYMAPEQAEPFEGIDARADIYSLGAVLYHLVTGATPGTPDRVMPLDELRPGLPWAVTEAVARAMEPDRERRWPTAAAFANELDRIAHELERAADGAERTGDDPEPGTPGRSQAPGPAPAAPDPDPAPDGRDGSGAGSSVGADRHASAAAPLSSLAVRPASQGAGQPPAVATESPSPAPGGAASEVSSEASSGTSSEASSEASSGPSSEAPGSAAREAPGPDASAARDVPPAVSAPAPEPQSQSKPPEGDRFRTAAAEDGAPRRRRRWRAVAMGTVVVVLTGVGVASAVLAPDGKRKPSQVRVSDASGRISVRIPGEWAKETADSGWHPSSLGLPVKDAPGLLVAQDVSRWQDLTSATNGVFVGLGSTPEDEDKSGASAQDSGNDTGNTDNADGADSAAETLPAKVAELDHRGCQYSGSSKFKGADWQGHVRTWSACGSPGHSLKEIGLTSRQKGKPPVYVQIRCDEDCSARTDQVLNSLRVNGS
ncbi:serine/threonine-protein kinase [Streptomyces sp. RK75]|uniref:serine/threonine-protein kinase n=1 Tax=Streptomyces sp. RK75 TaxID=2824895 RepID=UPI001B3984DF|nr:serine/threonine-protein kinase [Streptomyces sp. RK75]MBQ0867877.1 protein kinase [Streptomyces sp. RK75]